MFLANRKENIFGKPFTQCDLLTKNLKIIQKKQHRAQKLVLFFKNEMLICSTKATT